MLHLSPLISAVLAHPDAFGRNLLLLSSRAQGLHWVLQEYKSSGPECHQVASQCSTSKCLEAIFSTWLLIGTSLASQVGGTGKKDSRHADYQTAQKPTRSTNATCPPVPHPPSRLAAIRAAEGGVRQNAILFVFFSTKHI